MSLLRTLDRVFGMPGLAATGASEPRNLRWLPLLALAALATGYATLVFPGNIPHNTRFAGVLLFGLGYGSSFFFRIFGPRIFYGVGRPLDERDRALRDRSGHISGWIVGVLAVASYFYFGIAIPFGWWSPTKVHEWTLLGLLFQATFFILPVLVASWLQVSPEGD